MRLPRHRFSAVPRLGYCYPILLLSFASAARHECKYTKKWRGIMVLLSIIMKGWWWYEGAEGGWVCNWSSIYCHGLPELWLVLLFDNHHFFEHVTLLKIAFSKLQKLLDLERVTANATHDLTESNDKSLRKTCIWAWKYCQRVDLVVLFPKLDLVWL